MIASKFTDRIEEPCVQTLPTWVLSAISVVLGLAWGSPAASGGPLFPGAQYDAGRTAYSVAIDDLDGDGDADLAVANYRDDNVSILLNHGDGTFAPDVTYGAGDGPRSVAIVDLDVDGDAELAVANYYSDNVSVLINRSAAIPGDIDGDGDVDLADLAALLADYGTCVGDPNYNPDADLDNSGCVDLSDLATLLANYGTGT